MKEDHDQVRLFTFVLDFNFVGSIWETIVDDFLSFTYVRWNEAELINILRVGHNIVPRSSCDGKLWIFGILELLDGVWISVFKSKVLLHVVVHGDHLVSLAKSGDIIEMWEVLINFHLLLCHSKAILHQSLTEVSLGNSQTNSSNGNKHQR